MIKSLVLLALVSLSVALPYADQMSLANSLIVGKDDESDLANWECKVCDPSNKPTHAHFIHQEVKDIKCILSVYPNFIILAFRYTNTALNVWQDILYPLQIEDEHTCKNCKVQKAYNTMWDSIKPEVLADLIAMKKSTGLNSLIITGISLGGGLSVISYIDINQAKIFGDIKVSTFGAPRVGNKNWANHFDQITGTKTKRFYVSGDPVAVLPKCLTILCNYQQTGLGIACYEDKKLCIQTAEPAGLVNQINNLRTEANFRYTQVELGAITDHTQGYPKIYNHTLEITG